MNYEIELDTVDLEQNNTSIVIKRNDVGSHSLVLKITESGAEKDLSEYKAVVRFVRSDRRVVVSGELEAEGNVVTYVIDDGVTRITGFVKGEVSLYKEDERLTTNMFRLRIADDIDTDGGVEGDDRVPILDEMMSQLLEIYRQLEEAGTIKWENIIDRPDIEGHMANTENPHNVLLEQTGTQFITNTDIFEICK